MVDQRAYGETPFYPRSVSRNILSRPFAELLAQKVRYSRACTLRRD